MIFSSKNNNNNRRPPQQVCKQFNTVTQMYQLQANLHTNRELAAEWETIVKIVKINKKFAEIAQ